MVPGGVTRAAATAELTPRVPGFRAAGVRCGIKDRGLDLALIESEVPATAAGVFTRSTVVGAPVVVSRERLRAARPAIRAIVANSGCANVAVGRRGLDDAEGMATATARGLGCAPREILVASTGLIGTPLPMARLRRALPRVVQRLGPGGLAAAARAIMTTDTVPKIAARRLRIDGCEVQLAGIAKGAGMIEPNTATLLSFLLTDAAVSAPLLDRLLRSAVDASFNRVTVDGEASTSDSIFLLANGRAGHAPLRRIAGRDGERFSTALRELCEELAQAIARDGEGATKLVTVRVEGAKTRREAELAARRIANSLLVKTALFGADPNWGRILQTVGAARVAIDIERASVWLSGVAVFDRGRPRPPGAAARRLLAPEVEVRVQLAAGTHAAQLWTCDLSSDYVRINAEYHT